MAAQPTDTDKRVIITTGENPYKDSFGPPLNETVDPYANPEKDPFTKDGFVGVSEYYRNFATHVDAPLDDKNDDAPSVSDFEDGEDGEDGVDVAQSGKVPTAPQAPAAPSRGDITNEQEGVKPSDASDKS